MNKIRFSMTLVILFLIFSIGQTLAQENNQQNIFIENWLKLGPVSAPLPVFSETADVKGKKFEVSTLLNETQINTDNWWPTLGEKVQWDKITSLQWQASTADTGGFIHIAQRDSVNPEIAFFAAYVDVSRWMKAEVSITSPHLLHAFMDGESIGAKSSSDKIEEGKELKPGSLSKELKLETGKHILIIKAMKDPCNSADWQMKACLKLTEDWKPEHITATISPKHSMNIKHLLDGPKVTSASMSPDGELIALSIRKTLPPSDKSESWIELRSAKNNALIQTYRGGMKLGRVDWAPIGKRFSYTTSEKDGSTLWIVDLEGGTSTPLLENLKNMGGCTWSPDGSFIIYSVSEEPEENKKGLKKLQGMPDRWPGWRNRSFLYLVNVSEGTRRKLTHGHISTDLNSISHDSERLLFSRSMDDFTERPYSKTELWILNLKTMTLDSLWTTRWSGAAQWSPDDSKLLVTGGPSMFGEIGVNVSDGKIPNDYDIQAYIYDLASKKIEAISKNFNPAIGSAFWSDDENCIYFSATDKSYQRLFRYDLKKKQFEHIDTGIEVLSNIDFALNKPLAVYTGTSASVPPKAYFIDLKKKEYRIVDDPGKSDFENVMFNDVERWTFQNTRGTEIEGRIYYPPNFDSAKKYPCIVYYYGGTSPVTRDFGGRYPKNLYAAQGYVVYVLQPSGATGFGQEFSALHVNDWGIIVADEIIDGVKQFLDTHSFVDRNRVGCIGASYGGFMTMLLQTRTDIFATAISHAGISSLASYWGEGYWGYLYSAVATANSFPWNRKDIYVDQSALFNADKINTPLLLLHGAVDTNVPPGESIQLYTALKLLGKEVELIEIEGQNHHIMQYNKRILWTKTIMAWFDKWLKDEPRWWNDLYPEN